MLNNYFLKISRYFFGSQYLKVYVRNYTNIFSKEFNVSQFCTLSINCPYNIQIKPIDVFESQEKVFIGINSKNGSELADVQCRKDGDKVSVDIPLKNYNENYTLNINASVKASLNVRGTDGTIDIGSFYGNFIDVSSNNGNINLLKSQCDKISLITNAGDITCKDVIQAGDIILQASGHGTVTTDRLQGLKLKATTASGAINVGSSYCDNSVFETDYGTLSLRNIHKHVILKINHEGLLDIVAFDGELFAYIKKGLADIQLAKLTKDSQIIIEEASSLILRLAEECQKSNLINISSKNYVLSDTLDMKSDRKNDSCSLSPHEENEHFQILTIKCENSHVLVDSASWSEIFKATIKKKT